VSLSGQDVIDRIELAIYQLLVDANEACGGARNAWLFFMALLAYFMVALGGVTHKDLLLNSEVALPLLQVSIPLRSFFVFAPLILVLVHFGILQQHIVLARKLKELHERLTRYEGNGSYRTHRFRTQLHPYAFAQAIAGPSRSPLLAGFFYATNWVTLGLLPLVLLMQFQVGFLPYHDGYVTGLHRFYLVLDCVIVLVIGIFLRYPERGFVSGLTSTVTRHFVTFAGTLALWTGALLFAFTIATIPDEGLDVMMRSVLPRPIGVTAEGKPQRVAFAPTAYLFEGAVDPVSGQPQSLFTRNLAVADTDLVKDATVGEQEASLSLRQRDLRYARFERSDMHQVDFTGANLTGAQMSRANLEKARLNGADLTRADLSNAVMIGADLRKATLVETDLRRSFFLSVRLAGARFERVQWCMDDPPNELGNQADALKPEPCPPK
jgi:Pentapeptide repeats (8 copies)